METKSEPKTEAKDRAVKPGTCKVRANEPIGENGEFHDKGQEFAIAEDRLSALGRLVTRVAVLALLAVSLCLTAHAQQYDDQSVSITNTLNANLTTTANMGLTNTLTKYEEVGLQFARTPDADFVGSNIVVRAYFSRNGSKFATSANFEWTISSTATAGTEVVAFTNMYVGSAGYFKVTAQNTHGTANFTNCSLRKITKPVRNGR